MPVTVLHNLGYSERLYIASSLNEVNETVVTTSYFNLMDYMYRVRGGMIAEKPDVYNADSKIKWAVAKKWIAIGMGVDQPVESRREDKKETTRRVSWTVMNYTHPWAWDVLKDDDQIPLPKNTGQGEKVLPLATQTNLAGFFTRVHTGYGQLCYLAFIDKKGRKGVSNRLQLVAEGVEIALAWEYQLLLVRLVWPEEGTTGGSEDLPKWSDRFVEDLIYKVSISQLTEALCENLLRKVGKLLENGAPNPKDLMDHVLLDMDLLVQKHWPKKEEVSVTWPVAKINTAHGRDFNKNADPPAAPKPKKVAATKATKKRAGGGGGRSAPRTKTSVKPSAAPSALPSAKKAAASANVVKAVKAPTPYEKGIQSRIKELLAGDGQTLDQLALFKHRQWEEFCPYLIQTKGRESVDLIIVDGPWEVMDKYAYPRDYEWTEGAYQQLSDSMANLVKRTGTVLIYYGFDQGNKWNTAMVNAGFERDTQMVITHAPKTCNRRQMASSRMMNGFHQLLVFKKIGAGSSVTRNLHGQAFFLDCPFSTRCNVISNYRPPKSKVYVGGKAVRKEEKHKDIYREFYARFSNTGDVVFEPFAGTAAGAKAAVVMNRKWWGCEKDGECFEASQASLARYIAIQQVHGALMTPVEAKKSVWPTHKERQSIQALLEEEEPVSNKPNSIPPELDQDAIIKHEEAKYSVLVQKSKIENEGGTL